MLDILIILILIVMLFQIIKTNKCLEGYSKKTDGFNEYSNNELSEYELECLQREKDFDDRINNLRLEINRKNKSKPADESDGVKNLPHSIIDDVYDIKGIEVAE